MEVSTISFRGRSYPYLSAATLVLGSGAAGLNAAHELKRAGRDVLLLTDTLGAGTSFCAGSDKQTYYKLSIQGEEADSVQELAETFFAGGGMHGDNARVLAALSVRSFMKLVQWGVPFLNNRYGEYLGYKTDHDPRTRATSAGPLTSKFMGEALLRACREAQVPIREGLKLGAVLTGRVDGVRRAAGLLLFDAEGQAVLASGRQIVLCVGGAAGAYADSVYPLSQQGAMGHALRAGIRGNNLQHWQFGLGSLKVRWNLSGSYQQVLPCYYSTDAQGGDRQEFLGDAFSDYAAMCRGIFLKGYQWPFDPAKTGEGGSSLVDLAVVAQRAQGRRVFLDFRVNPDNRPVRLAEQDPVVADYLRQSGCTQDTPFARLRHMNPDAVEFYRGHGIDLEKEPLEIAVCAQHINGGLDVDAWWRTSLPGCYAAGECAGVFGRYRPGGSALNETQCGSLRAAQHITAHGEECPWEADAFLDCARDDLERELAWYEAGTRSLDGEKPAAILGETRRAMSGHASCQPETGKLRELAVRIQDILDRIRVPGAVSGTSRELAELIEVLYLQQAVLLSLQRAQEADPVSQAVVAELTESEARAYAIPVRPIPREDMWFENVWRDFREGAVFQ